MKHLLRFEICRSFSGVRFVAALALGAFLVVAHFVGFVIPHACSDLYETWRRGLDGLCPMSLFHMWFGMTGQSPFTVAFFIFAPLLSCMSNATELLDDVRTGFCNHALVRYAGRKYFASKMLSTFIAGGAVVCAPLILGFLLAAMMVPAIFPDSASGSFPIEEFNFMSGVYYAHPFAYVIVYIALNYVTYGLATCCGSLLGLLSGNKGVAVSAVFIFSMIAEAVSTALQPARIFSLRAITAPYQPCIIDGLSVLFVLMILIILTCALTATCAKRLEKL